MVLFASVCQIGQVGAQAQLQQLANQQTQQQPQQVQQISSTQQVVPQTIQQVASQTVQQVTSQTLQKVQQVSQQMVQQMAPQTVQQILQPQQLAQPQAIASQPQQVQQIAAQSQQIQQLAPQPQQIQQLAPQPQQVQQLTPQTVKQITSQVQAGQQLGQLSVAVVSQQQLQGQPGVALSSVASNAQTAVSGSQIQIPNTVLQAGTNMVNINLNQVRPLTGAVQIRPQGSMNVLQGSMAGQMGLQGTIIQTSSGNRILIQQPMLAGQHINLNQLGHQVLQPQANQAATQQTQAASANTTLQLGSATTPVNTSVTGSVNIQPATKANTAPPNVNVLNLNAGAQQIVIRAPGTNPAQNQNIILRTFPSNIVQLQAGGGQASGQATQIGGQVFMAAQPAQLQAGQLQQGQVVGAPSIGQPQVLSNLMSSTPQSMNILPATGHTVQAGQNIQHIQGAIQAQNIQVQGQNVQVQGQTINIINSQGQQIQLPKSMLGPNIKINIGNQQLPINITQQLKTLQQTNLGGNATPIQPQIVTASNNAVSTQTLTQPPQGGLLLASNSLTQTTVTNTVSSAIPSPMVNLGSQSPVMVMGQVPSSMSGVTQGVGMPHTLQAAGQPLTSIPQPTVSIATPPSISSTPQLQQLVRHTPTSIATSTQIQMPLGIQKLQKAYQHSSYQFTPITYSKWHHKF